MNRAVLLLVTLLTLGVVPATAQPPDKEGVVPALRRGGYVLFLRHPQTDPGQADTDPLHRDHTKDQRHLTDEGRAQAKAIGAALKRLEVPVGKVLASQFDRAREAATLLDLGAVEAVLDVTEGGLVVSPRENQRRAAALRKLLGTAPAGGRNTVIVSHKPNLQDDAGKEFGDLAEGEVAVFEPLGGGKFKLVARVLTPATWTEWAK